MGGHRGACCVENTGPAPSQGHGADDGPRDAGGMMIHLGVVVEDLAAAVAFFVEDSYRYG